MDQSFTIALALINYLKREWLYGGLSPFMTPYPQATFEHLNCALDGQVCISMNWRWRFLKGGEESSIPTLVGNKDALII